MSGGRCLAVWAWQGLQREGELHGERGETFLVGR